MARTTASTAPEQTVRPAPAVRTSRQGLTGGRASGRGFNAFKNATKESARNKDFGTFTVDYDKKYVIAFMEAENFDFIYRHWVDVVGEDGRTRQVPRNCIKDRPDGQECPLCQIGHTPKPVALFNVIDLDEPDKVQLWEVTTGIYEEIDALASSLAQIPEDRGGPLELNSEGVYVAVSKRKSETKSGKGGVTKYKIERVKERDLSDDYGLDPLTEEQFMDAMDKLKTIDDIFFSSYDDLKKLADSLED